MAQRQEQLSLRVNSTPSPLQSRVGISYSVTPCASRFQALNQAAVFISAPSDGQEGLIGDRCKRCIVSCMDSFDLILKVQSTQLIPIDPFLPSYITSIKSVLWNAGVTQKTVEEGFPNGSVITQRKKEGAQLNAEKIENLIYLIKVHKYRHLLTQRILKKHLV